MKNIMIYLSFCLLLFLIVMCPINIKAAPKTTYINEYYETYNCKYQINLEDHTPATFGTFEFDITFSKLGTKTDVIVKAVGENNVDAYGISELKSENKITLNKNYYNISTAAYYCPDLMAYFTTKPNEERLGVIATFTVKDFNKTEYEKTNQRAVIDRYYKMTNTNIVSYSCPKNTTKDSCGKQAHCTWVRKSGENYVCGEEKYYVDESGEDGSNIRTESCTDYVGSDYANKLEYKFLLDKTLTVNVSGAATTIAIEKVKDKNNQLWNLWKEGQCCKASLFGLNWEDNGDTMVLSCDGSDTIFDFEKLEDYYGDEDVDYGEPVYGCEVIPEEIREWIMDTLDLVKYVCLALVIILGVIDFIKAAASGEAEQVKKSGNSFLKRIVAVIILFLLPVIVELILNLIEIAGVDPNCFKD